MIPRSRLTYEFGPFRLEVAQCRLLRNGQPVPLRPKLFELLAVLVQRHGQVLEKDELLAAVWPDIEVSESNLTVSINALRQSLGKEQFIETIARHGYRFATEVRLIAGAEPAASLSDQMEPEQPGGAIPLHSRFYISRRTDEKFQAAIAKRDSIVLVKGARQVGKTSLLARGLQQARRAGASVVLTDFQHLTASAFENVEKLLLTLAEMIADQLDLLILPHQVWSSFLSPSTNFERYLRREVLPKIPASLVWGLDEVDRLFNFGYASEVFGLFRSWHNLRALEPEGPWPRLTLAMAYATEAHLFITDLNQSPFNVGTRLTLEDFSTSQIAELNFRYGHPLHGDEELRRFCQLVGGHPYLAQRGLYEIAQRELSLASLEAQADNDEGLFGDHLRRILVSLQRDSALCEALCGFLEGQVELTLASFYRLRSAGILVGDSASEARPRCELYARYLKGRLR